MATTTQILFNSPALHSLKRDQLVKLCKIHSIKANGKNTELIERLKRHAQALPPEALNPTSADEEDDAMDVEDTRTHGLPGGFPGNGGEVEAEVDNYAMQDVVLTSRFGIPRPSEQWEVVMDDIEEVDESGVGTMSSKGSLRTVSNGEFGTHSSKASVTSSLKALATSLGIKRATSKSAQGQDVHDDGGSTNSKGKEPASFSPGKLFAGKARDSLAEHATPYSQLPPPESLPDTDHFKFSTPDASILGLDDEDNGSGTEDAPVPGGSGRPGRPAPVGARLSMGVGQSTVRLVTHPAAPKFDDMYMSPPRLPVIQPDFDIKMGTPSMGRILSVWPASPRTATAGAEEDGEERMYPQLPLDDLKAARERAEGDTDDGGDEEAPMPGGMFASASTPAKTPARTRTTTATTNTTATPRPAGTPRPVDEPDMFSPSKVGAAPASAAAAPSGGERPPIPRSAPFLFGSPLPRRETPKTSATAASEGTDSGAGVSNIAFEGAAKSVLEEMHRRLAEAQKEREKNGESKPTSSAAQTGSSIFGGLTFGAGAAGGGDASAADRFAKVHEAQFAKMDSIANHYAARRPAANNRKRKSDALGPGASGLRAGQKRRSSAAGTRVISNGARRNRAVPGGFGAEEEDESDEEGDGEGVADPAQGREDEAEEDLGARRSSKRMRIAEGWDVHRGQRVSIAPPLPPAEEEKKQKERDAIKRELDAAKARRRSSRGRLSMGGKAAAPAKGKASRFGFLSSAKSIVRNVWNLGAGGKARAAANTPPSSIPVAKASAAPPAAAKIDGAQKLGKAAASKAAPAPATAPQGSRKPSGTHSRIPSASSTSSKLLKPSAPAASTDAKTTGTVTSTKSSNSRARSPIPPFTQPPAPTKATASRPSSVSGTARSRVSGTAGTASSSRQSSRTSTASSMGTRSSLASGTSSTAVSSIGTRRSLASTSTLASTSSRTDTKTAEGKDRQTGRKRTSSLLAPTASSLAKANAAVKPSMSGRSSGLPSVAETQKRPTGIPAPSKSPTNVASSRFSPMSPPPTRIFSQPLTNFGSPTSTGSPAHHPSLDAAASTLFTNADDTSPSKIPRPAVIPPKPKVLVARKPRISRSRVLAKVGAQRAAAAQGSAASPNARTRSSFGARRSFGGVKSGRASTGSEIREAAKKRARQSEYMRRKSRAGTSENEGRGADEA
ncbi:hypothetical protein BV20DRAFT_975033 [Pilatotrama ljubarskyi]|nr:hypothetical protein BV20DRAFT_975033 [Pilatotrama ljubarskyi]